jgi:competence CoiA-like predicted nuclease
MKEILLFWALKNNQIVHISEVLNGLKYECVCPVCNGKLEAHKGQKK